MVIGCKDTFCSSPLLYIVFTVGKLQKGVFALTLCIFIHKDSAGCTLGVAKGLSCKLVLLEMRWDFLVLCYLSDDEVVDLRRPSFAL